MRLEVCISVPLALLILNRDAQFDMGFPSSNRESIDYSDRNK